MYTYIYEYSKIIGPYGGESSLFISKDFGVSWIDKTPPGATLYSYDSPNTLTMSDSGQLVVVGTNGMFVIYIINCMNGITTVNYDRSDGCYVSPITGSTDGAIILYGGCRYYRSNDYAQTFIETSSPGSTALALASDVTGYYMFSINEQGCIYTSNDQGASWKKSGTICALNAVTTSGDGSNIAVVSKSDKKIYIGRSANFSIYSAESPTPSLGHIGKQRFKDKEVTWSLSVFL